MLDRGIFLSNRSILKLTFSVLPREIDLMRKLTTDFKIRMSWVEIKNFDKGWQLHRISV